MKSLLTNLLACCTIVALTGAAHATDLGDPAPALQIAEWVKGTPVDLAAGKGTNVYVVEFWATWCPPCRESIPHLTGLQKKYGSQGVVFVGVSDEKASVVKPFVKKMGDKMDYHVAVDQDGKTAAGYMEAFGIDGIPHAFVVDKAGRIVWHGHPMAGLDQILDQVLAGKYNMADAKKRDRARALLEQFQQLAAEDKDQAGQDKLAKELTSLDKELGGIVSGETFDPARTRKSARFAGLMREYQATLSQEETEPKRIEDLETQIAVSAPEGFDVADLKARMRFGRLWMKYLRAASDGGDPTRMPELAQQIDSAKPKDAKLLNELAWTLLTDERITKRDPQLALVLAKAAYDGGGDKDTSVVDTYARALLDNDKVEDAVRFEKKAVELCDDPQQRPQLEKTLAAYEKQLKAKGQ